MSEFTPEQRERLVVALERIGTGLLRIAENTKPIAVVMQDPPDTSWTESSDAVYRPRLHWWQQQD